MREGISDCGFRMAELFESNACTSVEAGARLACIDHRFNTLAIDSLPIQSAIRNPQSEILH
jgi:hypothetical protein